MGCAAHLPGEEDGCVEVLRILIVGFVEALLPPAKVPQRLCSIGRHLQPLLRLPDHNQSCHHQVDWVPQAVVTEELGSSCHDGEKVGFETCAMEVGHFFISHYQRLHVPRDRSEPLKGRAEIQQREFGR